MDRKALWSWALYDWGNSAFATTVMTGLIVAGGVLLARCPIVPSGEGA